MSAFDFWKGYKRAVTGVSLELTSFALLIGFFALYAIIFFILMMVIFVSSADLSNYLAFQFAGLIERGYLLPNREFLSAVDSAGASFRFAVSERNSIPELGASVAIIERTAVLSGIASLVSAAFFSYLTAHYLVNYQARKNDAEFIRGGRFVELGVLVPAIKRADENSTLMLGELPVLRSLLNRHFGFFGDTGTGKSQALLTAADWARGEGFKGFIVDKTGEFVQHLYDPNRDIILSPFDDRTHGWTPYNEGQELYDFERLAKSFIPTKNGGKDDHWPEASVTVLCWLFYRLFEQGRTEVDDLIDVLSMSHERVEADALGQERIVKIRGVNELLKGTLADIVVDPSSPEHAGSVLASIIPKIRSLFYLRGLEKRRQFSIRDWAGDDTQTGWIFIRVSDDQLDSVNPVVTAWIDTLIKTILSLPKSSTRVIAGFIDELQSFEKINSLGKSVFEGRKHGLRMFVGCASVNALHDIYGERTVKGFMSMLGTKVIYRTSEPDAAAWNSKLLLEEDVISEQQGISFGTNDNLSSSDRRERQALVTASEIAILPDLQAYVRFAGDWPTTLTKFTYREWPTNSESFVKRTLPAPVRVHKHKEDAQNEAEDRREDGSEPKLEPLI
ncbi:MAG: type IV secretion system DNA-binding domain-containing protein [Marinobacter sp.]|nr:type IV secretion system DNA-binding domain-containing protein [Marinobacter sp.]